MFSILQQRTTSIRAVALCPTMDLLVVINTRGDLTLYRALTWEKVFGKSSSDITESGTSLPVTVSFCSSGRALGIGCSEGQVLVLDLESQVSLLSQRRSHSNHDSTPILRVTWVSHDASTNNDLIRRLQSDSGNSCQSHLRSQTWKYGGTNLADRIGMMDAVEPHAGAFGESTEGSIILAITRSTQSSVLLSMDASNHLNGYLFGVYHILSVNCQPMVRQSLKAKLEMIGGSYSITGFFLAGQWGRGRDDTSTATMSPSSSSCGITRWVQKLSIPYLRCVQCRFKGLEHIVSIHLAIQVDLAKLQDMVSNHGRKWKDATRVILPKLSLLQGVLDSYQLPMSPVQFMYVVAQCGLWHPAALSSFSQHWNEQGIARLRSTIDSTSNAIVRTLQLKAIPVATNVCLRCRELLAVTNALGKCCQVQEHDHTSFYVQSNSTPSSSPSSSLSKLLQQSELLLFKLDETLQEARLAREGMMLYLQFIKDCTAVPADEAAAPPIIGQSKGGANAIALSSKKYQQIFDPRRTRAEAKGPLAHAETVTGTHLYAYLQDQELPKELFTKDDSSNSDDRSPKERSSASMLADILSLVPVAEVGESSSSDSSNNSSSSNSNNSSSSNSNNSSSSNSNHSSSNKDDPYEVGTSRHSLLQQVKQTKEAFVRAFHAMHDEVSSSILPTTPAVDIETSAISAAAAVAPSLDLHLAVQLPERGVQYDSPCCGDDAVACLLWIRVASPGGACVETTSPVTVVLDSAVVTTLAVAGELYVLCREDQSGMQTRHQYYDVKESRALASRVVYAARLVLGGSVISSNVMRLRLCIAPLQTTAQLPHLSRVSSPEEDDNSSEGSSLSSSRVTAVVGLTAAASSSSAAASLENVCFFRINIKDLQFTAIKTNIPDSSDRDPIDAGLLSSLPMHAISGGVDNNSAVLLVPVRHRLLELEIPVLASQNLILEVSPARGIAVVGSLPTPELVRGTKLIVLDLENNEEDVDDDDDNDDDDDEGAMES